MKVKFTLDLGDLKEFANQFNAPGFLKVKNPEKPTVAELKQAAKLYFYENSCDELLYNCPTKNIEILPD